MVMESADDGDDAMVDGPSGSMYRTVIRARAGLGSRGSRPFPGAALFQVLLHPVRWRLACLVVLEVVSRAWLIAAG